MLRLAVALPPLNKFIVDDLIKKTRVAKLLGELAGVACPRRTAAFVCAAVLASPEGVLAEARYTLEGPLGRAHQWLVAEVDGDPERLAARGLRPMPIGDQMRLQLALIDDALRAVGEAFP